MAVVVVVADADALSPAFVGEPGLPPDLGEPAVTVVVIELRKSFCPGAMVEGCAVGDEDIFGAVAVVIEDRGPVACGFEDVALAGFAAGDIGDREAGGWGDVFEGDGGIEGYRGGGE